MIEDFRALAVFVAVADSGSFSAAARRLKISKSVVSHHISKLENKLSVSLFFRTSRRMSLTSEGLIILDHAREMVDAGERALDALTEDAEQPVGALRISAPAFGEGTPLRQVIWEFARLNPLVAISLSTSDVQADLVKDGFDLAIRLGKLADSSLRCRRIGSFHRILVASKEYLASRPSIDSPEDLSSCDFISVDQLPDQITLSNSTEEVTIEAENIRIEVNSITAAKSAVLAGLGLRGLPSGEVEQELADEQLERVLPDWSIPIYGVYAVWPDIGPQKKLTRRLIDFILTNESQD